MSNVELLAYVRAEIQHMEALPPTMHGSSARSSSATEQLLQIHGC